MSENDRLLRVCKNCFDYDNEKAACVIRFTIMKDKTRKQMKRKPDQNGCEVFMYKPEPT